MLNARGENEIKGVVVHLRMGCRGKPGKVEMKTEAGIEVGGRGNLGRVGSTWKGPEMRDVENAVKIQYLRGSGEESRKQTLKGARFQKNLYLFLRAVGIYLGI